MSVNISLSCSFIKLSNAFVFPDPKPPIISIRYGRSGIYGHIGLCTKLFSFVITSRLNIFVCYKNFRNKILLQMSFWDEKETKILFTELPFYNALIEKPYIKHLNNIDMLREFSFQELNIVKVSKAFK